MSGRDGSPRGVRIAGTGSYLPQRAVTNADLEKMMDTSDAWIRKRTGIAERRVADQSLGETSSFLAAKALQAALDDAGMTPDDIEFIVAATMTPEMPTPSVSCLTADLAGCGAIGAIDMNAACSGFIFSINTAQELVRGGMYKTIAVIGTDIITRHADYTTNGRAAAILFGDAAAGVILTADENPELGMTACAMHSDAGRANILYIPMDAHDFSEEGHPEQEIGRVQMNGQQVFKFAVTKFPAVIAETLEIAGLEANDVDHYICHQANARILEAARQRFGLPEEKLRLNIDRYGNSAAASAPLVFDELWREGKIQAGQKIMFLSFGAGLTWGSSLWQL